MCKSNLPRDTDGKLSTFAWPGGYPIYYLCDDSGVLCPSCANKHGHERAEDNDGFRLMGADVHWEGDPLICDHCGASIESAYGIPD